MNNYYDDSPITSKKQDVLSRGDFATGLAKTLLKLDADNGLCVALYGPWGSGKTSILNLMLEELENAEDFKDSTVVLKFNPWRFTSEEQLFHQFFIMLAHAFSDSKDKKLKKIADEIEQYVVLAEAIDNRAKIATLLFKQAKKSALKNNIFDQDLSKQKELIIKRIIESNSKVLIVIDDMDRLSSSEIKLLFKLIKSVANFPNTIYLMAFDREVVVTALTEPGSLNGEQYLEKIIQVPIEIPLLRDSEVSTILLSKLNEIVKTFGMPYDPTRFQHAYYECVDLRIHSLREIKRLSNLLYTKCMIAGETVDFTDLLVLSLIELQYPDLYRWIKSNKETLVGGERYSLLNLSKKPEQIGEENMAEIEKLNATNKQYYLDVLVFLFPFFKTVGRYGREAYSEASLRRCQRVGHPDFFEHYFCLGLKSGEIDRKMVDQALFEMQYDELESYLDSINGSVSIDEFLKEIQAAVAELPEERKKLLVKLLIRKANSFDSNENSRLFYLGPKSRAEYIVKTIIESLKNDSTDLILDELKDADEATFYFLAELINTTELAYGKLAANGIRRSDCTPVISENRLAECEQSFVKRWQELSASVDWLNTDYPSMVLYLLKCFDKDGYESFVREKISSDLDLLRFVQLSAGMMTGTEGISYIYSNDYSEYVSDDLVLQAIERCVSNKSLFTLAPEQIIRILAFVLWAKKDNDFDDVKLIDIEELLKEYEEKS